LLAQSWRFISHTQHGSWHLIVGQRCTCYLKRADVFTRASLYYMRHQFFNIK
jgi:hypothetical protein